LWFDSPAVHFLAERVLTSGVIFHVDTDFILIPQNGQEILTMDGESTGTPATNYINAINGVGREDLFYGYSTEYPRILRRHTMSTLPTSRR